MLAILLRIPDIILQAEYSVDTFYPDLALYDKAEELYLAILGAIEGAVEWLKEHPLRKLQMCPSFAYRLMIKSGKQARCLVQGSRYSKSFTAKEQALDHALMALEQRAGSLRDNAIMTTQKTAGRVESVVNQVAITDSLVDSRTKTTLCQVLNLQKQAKDMIFVAEHTDKQLSSVATGIQTFTQTLDTINAKIDGLHGLRQATHSQVEMLSDINVKIDSLHGVQQATHSQAKMLSDIKDKIDSLHGLQQATHSQVEMLSDMRQTITQAVQAMENAFEKALDNALLTTES